MNKTTSVIMLLCGLIIVLTQLVEMLNKRPILLAVGCLFSLGGFICLLCGKR